MSSSRRLIALLVLPLLVFGAAEPLPLVTAIFPVQVTPDNSALNNTAHGTNWSRIFTVTNNRTSITTYTLTCQSTGQVSCGSVTPASVILDPNGDHQDVTVTYTTADTSTGNLLKLAASGAGVTDTGSYVIKVLPSTINIVTPVGSLTRLVVHNRQPVIRAEFSTNADVAQTSLSWRGTAVTSLTRHNARLIEWEVDSTRWLAVGDSAQLTIQQTAAGVTSTESRWVVLPNDSLPVIGFAGMPFEALNGGFSSGFGPGFSVNGAEVETGFGAISYISMGSARSAGLSYSTRTSYPRALVNADVEIPWPSGTPTSVKVYLWDGAVKMDSLILSSPSLTPCTQGSVKRCRVTLQADFSGSAFSTPTRKQLGIEVQVTSGGTTKSATDSVEVVLVDRRATQYGSGWWPSGISRLYALGSDRVLVGASGSATIFRGSGDSLYLSPPGSFTALVKTASGWELRPRGSTAKVRFDSNGRLAATVDNNGNKDSVTYTGSTDTVTSLIDPVGKTISFAYTSGRLNRITTLTAGAARDVHISIDGTSNQLTYFRLPYTVSSDGAKLDTVFFTYQGYPGTKTNVITRRLGLLTDTTRIVYDSTFKRRPVQTILPRVMDPNGSWVLPNIDYTAYEAQGYHALRSLDSVYVELKDPRDNWTRSLLNRWAQTRKTWDELGLIGNTQYDPDGFVLSSEGENGDSSRTYTVYDSFRRPVKSYIVRAANDTLRGDSLVYDANHRVIKRINNLNQRDSMAYDANGNLTKVFNAAGQLAQTWYRVSDGLVDSVRSIGATASVQYNYEGTWKNLFRVLDQDGTTLDSTLYDSYGRGTISMRKIRVRVDADSTRFQWRKTVSYLNLLNLTDSTTLYRTNNCSAPCNTPPSWPADNDTTRTQHVRFRRDRAGQDSLRYNDRGIATMYVHDKLGRLTSRRPWTDSMAVKDTMVYDVAGNLRTTVTRRGHTIASYQDSRNRDTLTTIPGIGDQKSTYGGPQDQLTRLYLINAADSIGKVKREVRWGYDQRGRLKQDTTYAGDSLQVTSYGYDHYERSEVMTDRVGSWYTRYHATLGLPIRLVTPFSDSMAYSYDTQLRVSGPTIVSSGPTQTIAQFYTSTNGLDSLIHTVATTPSAFTPLSYASGASDEPSYPSTSPFWKEQHGAGAVLDTLRDSVAYDGWERVTASVQFRNGVAVARDTFNFDRTGNIKTTAGVEVYEAVTGRLTYRVNGIWQDSLIYDRAGNLDSIVSKKAGVTHRWGYDWDALNRLVTVRYDGTLMARYSYDVLGRRITKRVYNSGSGGTVGYTRFVYHGSHVAFDTDSSATMTYKYIWGMGTDDLIGVWFSSNIYYAVKDKLGSIRGLVKRDSTWKYSERFGPYGAQAEVAGVAIGLRYKWTGREYDPETGWYFFRARHYEPAARRFVQEDPVGFGGGSNLYAYADGNPLDSRDPSGLLKEQARFGNAGPDNWSDPSAWLNFMSGGAWGMRLASISEFQSLSRASNALFNRWMQEWNLSVSLTVTHAGNSETVKFDVRVHGGVHIEARPDHVCRLCADIPNGAVFFAGGVIDAFAIGGSSFALGAWVDNKGYGLYGRAAVGFGEDISVGMEAGTSTAFDGWSVGGQLQVGPLSVSVSGNMSGWTASYAGGIAMMPGGGNIALGHTWTYRFGYW